MSIDVAQDAVLLNKEQRERHRNEKVGREGKLLLKVGLTANLTSSMLVKI